MKWLRLKQWHNDGKTSTLVVNSDTISNIQERLNVPAGTPELDPVTKEFPKPKMGSVISFDKTHAFVVETADELYGMLMNAEVNRGK